jgi:hypothetical protein
MPDAKPPSREHPADPQLRSTREQLLPPLTASPRVILSSAEIAELELSDGARRVIPHLDGKTTVHDLLEGMTAGDNLFDLLDELLHEGVIELSKR